MSSALTKEANTKTPNMNCNQLNYNIIVDNFEQSQELLESPADRSLITSVVDAIPEQEYFNKKDPSPNSSTLIDNEDVDVSHPVGSPELLNSQKGHSPIIEQINRSPSRTNSNKKDEPTAQLETASNKRVKLKKRKLALKLLNYKLVKRNHPCHCRTVVRKIKIRDAETQTSPA